MLRRTCWAQVLGRTSRDRDGRCCCCYVVAVFLGPGGSRKIRRVAPSGSLENFAASRPSKFLRKMYGTSAHSVCCCTPPGSMPGGGGCRRRRWAPICFKQVDHPLAVADHELVVAPRSSGLVCGTECVRLERLWRRARQALARAAVTEGRSRASRRPSFQWLVPRQQPQARRRSRARCTPRRCGGPGRPAGPWCTTCA